MKCTWVLVGLGLSFTVHANVGNYIKDESLFENSCAVVFTDKKGEKSVCSSTVISRNQVLSAAHCGATVEKDDPPTEIHCPFGVVRTVTHWWDYPDYAKGGVSIIANDGAILTVDRDFGLPVFQKAADAREAAKLFQKGPCSVQGYGYDNEFRRGALHGVSNLVLSEKFTGLAVGRLFLDLSSLEKIIEHFSSPQPIVLHEPEGNEKILKFDEKTWFYVSNRSTKGDSGGTVSCLNEENESILIGNVRGGSVFNNVVTPVFGRTLSITPDLADSEESDRIAAETLGVQVTSLEKLTQDCRELGRKNFGADFSVPNEKQGDQLTAKEKKERLKSQLFSCFDVYESLRPLSPRPEIQSIDVRHLLMNVAGDQGKRRADILSLVRIQTIPPEKEKSP